MNNFYNRKSMRLKDYNYSQNGIYFVTICTQDMECLFGNITNEEMMLNEYGQIVKNEWLKSFDIRKELILDYYIIMPNHIHGIVGVNGVAPPNNNYKSKNQGERRSPLHMKPKSLSSFIAGFKSSTTKQINLLRTSPGQKLWQRNYYDRIIRNEKELNKIREYIKNNPLKWELSNKPM